jgi:NAD(P)-dependent dehydrogenase (short-subunit alcohol dehydrogenase family)
VIDIPDLTGKTAIVTGSNTGIGEVTARELAAAGAKVILACRNLDKAEAAKSRMDGDVRVHALDLGSFDAVRQSASRLLEADETIDILVNNAGLAGSRGLTEDGFELAFGVNHLGHFLFTVMLAPLLVRATAPRIVTVASRAHERAKGIEYDRVRERAKSVTGMHEYEISKLANVMFSRSLHEKLEGVKTYSLHPGVVASDIWRRLPWPLENIMKLFMITNEEGAQTSLHCATAPNAESGLYWNECKPKRPNPIALDQAACEKLWQKSAEWTGADLEI